MSRNLTLLTGFGFGAGLMYAFDPVQGAGRRARVRDRIAHGLNKAADGFDATTRDVRQRLTGSAVEIRRRLQPRTASDDVLVARVRSALGRVVSHPRAVGVVAYNGHVRFFGPILTHEVKPLLAVVAGVPGVVEVDNQLDAHERAGELPALQGGTGRARGRYIRRHWPPATRLMAGSAGSILAAYGAMRRDLAGAGLAALGMGLLARGLTNLNVSRLGVGAGRRAVDLHKTVEICAPIGEVFDFWDSWESFPRFTTSVIDVRPTCVAGQWHWTVRGFAGRLLEFDTVVTRRIPHQLIGWTTTDGALVSHAAVIRFDPLPGGGTRLDLHMSYNPPAGALGDSVAGLLGENLKSRLDEEMIRIKTALETGNPPHDAARPPTPEARLH